MNLHASRLVPLPAEVEAVVLAPLAVDRRLHGLVMGKNEFDRSAGMGLEPEIMELEL